MKSWIVGLAEFVVVLANLGEAKGGDVLVDNGFSTAVSGGLTWQNFLDFRLFDDFSLGAPSAIQSVSYYMLMDERLAGKVLFSPDEDGLHSVHRVILLKGVKPTVILGRQLL